MKFRTGLVLIVWLWVCASFAQIPDVRFKGDLTISYWSRTGHNSTLRLFDPLGRPSLFSFTLYLEPGLKAYLAQRLERIPSDNDADLLDEIYVEDEGVWRLGKQYIPFGAGTFIHESAIAARADTNLIVEGLPVAAALFDGGDGWQRGVSGRVGRKSYGVSIAVGHHIGAVGTSLGLVRPSFEAPGRRAGWQQAYGLDVSRRNGIFSSKAEYVLLKNSDVAGVQDMGLFDVSFTSTPSKYQSFSVGWTRQSPDRKDFYRFTGSIFVCQGVTFEPWLRYLDGKLFDISLGMRYKF